MMSCAEFAQILNAAAETVKFELVEPTDVLMTEVANEAKRVIGTYEYGWPQLAESTQEDRVKRGFTPNNPLERTGELRDSIGHRAAIAPDGADGLVFSGEKKALWAEMGTVTQPARSFLMRSLIRAAGRIDAIYGAFAVKLFMR